MSYTVLRRLLFLLPPEWVHHVALSLLNSLPQSIFPKPLDSPCELMGIRFPNPVGAAAGWDNNADYLSGLAKLGFGFIEVGGVTPKPQPGNPKPRLVRFVKEQGLINRMGFPNKGIAHMKQQLEKLQYSGALGINLGKNKETPLDQAAEDYCECMQALFPYADYFTINLSSPNTPGLRELQQQDYLRPLLTKVIATRDALAKRVPLIVKLSPDMTAAELQETVAVLIALKVDGVNMGNSTLSREGVDTDAAGGLSGQPLTQRALQQLKLLRNLLPADIPIVALGGIMTAEDAKARFDAGAQLVQLMTGLVYRGPKLIREIISLCS